MDPEQEPRQENRDGEDAAPPDKGPQRLPGRPSLDDIVEAHKRGEMLVPFPDNDEEWIVSFHKFRLDLGLGEPHGTYERPSRAPIESVPRWWMEQVHPSETGEAFTDEELERGYDAGFLSRPERKP